VGRHRPYPPDFDADDIALWRLIEPYTLTSMERVRALADSVSYLIANRIPGTIVECGVWRGGSMMAAARTLLGHGVRDRDVYLFDTFAGMTQPTAADVNYQGTNAASLLARATPDPLARSFHTPVTVDEVRRNLTGTGYPAERLHFVEGPVEQTVPAAAPESIALLRLDTDWHQSTRHELEHLYPRLVPGGVLIIDDYGHWQGARRAVDDYFAQQRERPLLVRIDYTCRLAVKR